MMKKHTKNMVATSDVFGWRNMALVLDSMSPRSKGCIDVRLACIQRTAITPKGMCRTGHQSMVHDCCGTRKAEDLVRA